MTLVAYLNGSDVAYRVRLNTIGLTSYANGQAGAGGIEFDDEDGSMVEQGWMSVLDKETACVDAPVNQ